MLIATIRFQRGSAALREPSAALLDDLAATLRDRPAARVRVEAHADGNSGPAADRLSQARAETVRTALAARAVDSRRVVAIGCNKSQATTDRAREGRADLVILHD